MGKGKGNGCPSGIDHFRATIPFSDVILMRALRDEGLTIAEIARKFEVKYPTAVSIINRKSRLKG